MTEVPAAGTAASGRRACACQYPLYGTVRIEGQRMAVTVNSIESGGNILPVELVAYDMDGQEGLFVPNTAERTAMKEAAANIGGSFGTSISFARSASQQLVMDVTRGVLGGGSQYRPQRCVR